MKKWMLPWCLFFILCVLVFVQNRKGETLYQAPQQEAVETETIENSKPILFVGDVMLGRYVETLALQSGDEMRSFARVQSFLEEHVTIGNLEGPIPQLHKPTPINGFAFSFPSSTPRILKEAGITAVSLANNHMFDHGREGYENTKKALSAEGVSHFGGYAPTESSYFETALGTTTAIVYGVGVIATGWDEAQALEVTQKLAAEHGGKHLIAFLHWGNEYVTQNAYQRELAHKLIDAGVDTIIGAHPHVVQGVELYKGKPIFYSLGNFVFDQYWRADLEDGYMVKLSSKDSLLAYELIPIHSVRSVPYIATSTKRDQILTDIAKQSDADLRQSISEGIIQLP